MSDEQLYTVGQWHDLPNYECSLCPWSTTELAAMNEHILRRHRLNPPAEAPAPEPRRDRFGNLVEDQPAPAPEPEPEPQPAAKAAKNQPAPAPAEEPAETATTEE